MFAASAHELVKYRKDLTSGGHQLLLDIALGFVVSLVVAFFVVKWLLHFIQSHTFNGFAIYRVLLGGGLLVALALNPALAEIGKEAPKATPQAEGGAGSGRRRANRAVRAVRSSRPAREPTPDRRSAQGFAGQSGRLEWRQRDATRSNRKSVDKRAVDSRDFADSSVGNEMFQLLKTDPGSRARRGRLTTSHGVIETPQYMPVGTQATVKAVAPRDLDVMGTEIILANTYHLFLRPASRSSGNSADSTSS